MSTGASLSPTEGPARVRPWRLFVVALRLGLTAFGGPAAHLGHFQREFVQRRRWVSDAEFADLLALCQFLPGPGSSQVNFSVAYLKGGLTGALAAWVGFTLPSAVIMLLLAAGLSVSGASDAGWLRGLKVAAVAVVAQAVVLMARTLCPDWPRRGIGLLVAAAVLAVRVSWLPIAAIVVGAAVGGFCFRRSERATTNAGLAGDTVVWRRGVFILALFVLLLAGLPLLARSCDYGWLQVVDRFYRVGALVFGGGHVVLPLLEAEVVAPGWLSHDSFLAGYGAAQALPGPLFTLAAYLGAAVRVGPGGWLGGVLALIAIFLPGLLLVVGIWPFWQGWRSVPAVRAALGGANAAVVGLLAAALINPVGPAGLYSGASFVLAVLLLAALGWARCPAWLVVGLAAAAGQVFL